MDGELKGRAEKLIINLVGGIPMTRGHPLLKGRDRRGEEYEARRKL